MTTISVDKVKLSIVERELITSGSVNAFCIGFEFSEEWEGLEKTVLFRVGNVTKKSALDENNHCIIPKELLTEYNKSLNVCVYGKGIANHDHCNAEEEAPGEDDTTGDTGGTEDSGNTGDAGSAGEADGTESKINLTDEVISDNDIETQEPTEPTDPEDPGEPVVQEEMILSSVWISLGTIRQGITEADLSIGDEEEVE